VSNVATLRNPTLVAAHAGEAESIDHNQYVKGDRTFQANYRSGLRILGLGGVMNGILDEVGYFDVYPADDLPEFNGAWSNYPYFDDGKVIVSGIEQGLFVLCPHQDRATCGADASGAGAATPGGDATGGAQTAAAAGTTRALRAGFGRGSRARVKGRSFKVRCRAAGSGERVCRVTARWKRAGSGSARVVGRGKAVVSGRSALVRVKLNRLGRRLAKRPRGFRAQLALRVTDATGAAATARRTFRVKR
jgi:hypothetical protein